MDGPLDYRAAEDGILTRQRQGQFLFSSQNLRNRRLGVGTPVGKSSVRARQAVFVKNQIDVLGRAGVSRAVESVHGLQPRLMRRPRGNQKILELGIPAT